MINLIVSHIVNVGLLNCKAIQKDSIIHVKIRATVICVWKCTVNVPKKKNRIAVHISINSMIRVRSVQILLCLRFMVI